MSEEHQNLRNQIRDWDIRWLTIYRLEKKKKIQVSLLSFLFFLLFFSLSFIFQGAKQILKKNKEINPNKPEVWFKYLDNTKISSSISSQENEILLPCHSEKPLSLSQSRIPIATSRSSPFLWVTPISIEPFQNPSESLKIHRFCIYSTPSPSSTSPPLCLFHWRRRSNRLPAPCNPPSQKQLPALPLWLLLEPAVTIQTRFSSRQPAIRPKHPPVFDTDECSSGSFPTSNTTKISCAEAMASPAFSPLRTTPPLITSTARLMLTLECQSEDYNESKIEVDVRRGF